MKNEREAEFWNGPKDSKVRCLLCPHKCRISPGGSGLCGVRFNRNERLLAEAYGIYPAIHMDPIEKKPLNHFLPGSNILSLGSVGCNLSCLHCQNWSLARASTEGLGGYRLSVEELCRRTTTRGSIGVAFTYNEPTINYEFIMDCAPLLRENGSKVVLVTNGYLEPEPWDLLMNNTDAANIDIKGFTEEFYRTVTGGSLEPVLRNVRSSFEKGIHIEIAYLVIPGKNDDIQVDHFIDFMIKELSPEVPVHFNRFHPDHKMSNVPPTPPQTLFRIKKRAIEKGMENVFIGNMGGAKSNDTICPSCGKTLVSREGFWTPNVKIVDGCCPKCKKKVYGIW